MIETQNKLWDNARKQLLNRRKTLGKTYYIVPDNSKADSAASSYDEDLNKTLNGNEKFAPNSVFLNSSENTTNSGVSNKTTPILNESQSNLLLSSSPTQTKQTTGGTIKNNITNVLSNKYGPLDTKHIFDGIDDKDVEDNISTAESTIRTNIDSGRMSKDVYSLYPNMRDGLALSYAAADKGKNKAAKWAKEAAYTEINEPLVKKTDNKLLPNESIKYTTPFDYKKNNTPANNGKNYLFLDAFNYSKENKTNNNSEKSVDYLNAKSSTLDKYEPSAFDVAKDLLLFPIDAIWDYVGDIKGNDSISASIDMERLINPKVEVAKHAARAVWKAGSELYLKPNGLNISANMLEHSLQEKPEDVVFYDDSDVVKKIKTNSKFLSKVDEMTEAIQNKTLKLGEKDDLKFETNDDQDLYYSIHGCTMEIDDIKYNENGTKDISVHISDNYDYTKIWTSMEGEEFSPFRVSLGTLANDLGTITSKLDAINPYKVDIYFTIRR